MNPLKSPEKKPGPISWREAAAIVRGEEPEEPLVIVHENSPFVTTYSYCGSVKNLEDRMQIALDTRP